MRRHPSRELLAEGSTEQVVLNPEGELLLTFPAPVRTLVERILAYQRGEVELKGGKLLPLP